MREEIWIQLLYLNLKKNQNILKAFEGRHLKPPSLVQLTSHQSGTCNSFSPTLSQLVGQRQIAPVGHLMGIAFLLHKQTTKCLLMAQNTHGRPGHDNRLPNAVKLIPPPIRHPALQLETATKCGSVAVANVVTTPRPEHLLTISSAGRAKEQQHAQLEWFARGRSEQTPSTVLPLDSGIAPAEETAIVIHGCATSGSFPN